MDRWEKTPPRTSQAALGSASRRSAAGDKRKGITMAKRSGAGTVKVIDQATSRRPLGRGVSLPNGKRRASTARPAKRLRTSSEPRSETSTPAST